MKSPCRLGIDEELVALLGKHSPVGIPWFYFHPLEQSFQIA